jgi:anaerobic selenocysteine-containing dehydrogenase
MWGMFPTIQKLFGNCMDIKKVLTKPTKTISITDMHMFGTRMTGLASLTLESSRMILIWVANICETRFSSRIEAVIGRARQNGVPVIAVDPRRTDFY